MKDKHIQIRIEQCLSLAKASNCPRRKLGALLLDAERNVILADGYNGGPRGAPGTLCKGYYCERDGVTAEDLEIRESWRQRPRMSGTGTEGVLGVGVYSKVSQGVDQVSKDGLLQWFEKSPLEEKLAQAPAVFTVGMEVRNKETGSIATVQQGSSGDLIANFIEGQRYVNEHSCEPAVLPERLFPKTAQQKAEEWATAFIEANPPIPSGTKMERGCHHAEMNVICNAADRGVATRGAWMIVLAEPCMMCAKLIHHAGIAKVIVVDGGYLGGKDGVDYLRANGVEVQEVEGPKDPRLG